MAEVGRWLSRHLFWVAVAFWLVGLLDSTLEEFSRLNVAELISTVVVLSWSVILFWRRVWSR